MEPSLPTLSGVIAVLAAAALQVAGATCTANQGGRVARVRRAILLAIVATFSGAIAGVIAEERPPRR